MIVTKTNLKYNHRLKQTIRTINVMLETYQVCSRLWACGVSVSAMLVFYFFLFFIRCVKANKRQLHNSVTNAYIVFVVF